MLLDEIEALVSAKIAGANVEAEAADATGATGIADTTCETGSTGVMDTTGATGTSDVTDTIEPTGAAAADDETADTEELDTTGVTGTTGTTGITGAAVVIEMTDATETTGTGDVTGGATGATSTAETKGTTGTTGAAGTTDAVAADPTASSTSISSVQTAAEQAIAIGAAPATVLTLPVLAEAGDAFILNSMANVQIISQAAEGDYEYAITYELVLDGTVISTVVRQLQNLKTGSKVRTNLEVLFMTWSNTPGPGAHVYEIRIGVTGILLASASVLTRAFNMTVDSP